MQGKGEAGPVWVGRETDLLLKGSNPSITGKKRPGRKVEFEGSRLRRKHRGRVGKKLCERANIKPSNVK